MGIMNRVALEEIAFQNGEFFKELQIYFETMKGMKAKELKDSEAPAAIEKCIKHHTGLTVRFIVSDNNIGPCVIVPDVNKNNPLVSAFTKNFLNNADGRRMVANADGLVRGSVNLKTSMVTGIFTEVVSDIMFPSSFILGVKFTVGELAAMTLHEIGHLFTYYEFIGRTVTTNQVLSGITRTLEQSNDPGEREAVLVSAKKALSLGDLDVAKLAKITDKKVVCTVVISSAIKQATSEIGSNIYDSNNWEQLADQFAARHGAGRDLAFALEKLHKAGGDIAFRSTFTYFLMEAVKIVLMVGAITLAIVATPGGLGMAFAQLGVWLWLTLIVVDLPSDVSYDRPGVRLKRIRNQLLEHLKSSGLSADEKQNIIQDLVILDAQEKEVEDKLQLFNVLWGWISSSQRKRLEQESLQQELETLASNSLFLKAEQLKLV